MIFLIIQCNFLKRTLFGTSKSVRLTEIILNGNLPLGHLMCPSYGVSIFRGLTILQYDFEEMYLLTPYYIGGGVKILEKVFKGGPGKFSKIIKGLNF